jgi:hypothetical protein
MAYVQVAADYDWDVNVDEVGYKTICVLDQGGEWEQLTTSQKRTFLRLGCHKVLYGQRLQSHDHQ